MQFNFKKAQINQKIMKKYVGNNKINYIGRKPAASPATGYAKRHLSQQKKIIEDVFK